MDLLFIYGPPGVGKLTVARELAALTGCRVFHNHVSIDWAKEIFEFDTAPFWRLVDRLRTSVVEEAAREDVSLITTFVYAQPAVLSSLKQTYEMVEQHGGRVRLVQLLCEQEALEERVMGKDRAEMRKLASVESLREWIARHDALQLIPGRESLVIDNTHLPRKTPHAGSSTITACRR